MQQILAILAPALDDLSPAQRARAQRATLEQMMLLTRGFCVDSPAGRCAAAKLGSSVSGHPVEFELAPVPGYRARLAEPETAREQRGGDVPGWQRSDQYARYLRTILETQV